MLSRIFLAPRHSSATRQSTWNDTRSTPATHATGDRFTARNNGSKDLAAAALIFARAQVLNLLADPAPHVVKRTGFAVRLIMRSFLVDLRVLIHARSRRFAPG